MKIFYSQGSYNLLPPAELNLALQDTVNADGEKNNFSLTGEKIKAVECQWFGVFWHMGEGSHYSDVVDKK